MIGSPTMLGQIGIGSWTFPWAIGTISEHPPDQALGPAGLVERAVELEVTLVEILDNLPLHREDPRSLDQLRDGARSQGVALQPGTRSVRPDHLRRYLAIAQQLNASLLRTMCGFHGDPPPISEVRRDLRAVLPEFAAAGVSIALENYEAYSTVTIAELVRKLGHPNLGVCLDLTNSFGALESADDILDHLAPLAVHLHLKEFAVERLPYLMGFGYFGRPTGKGILPLERIFTRLADLKKSVNVVIEQWTPFQGTIQKTIDLERAWARESVAYLRSLPWFA